MQDLANLYQPGILEDPPPFARYVHFALPPGGADVQAVKDALVRLAAIADGRDVVVGIGPALVRLLGAQVPGLHEFPDDFSRGDAKVPSTPGTLWCWVRGDDPGNLLHLTRRLQKALAPAFVVRRVVDAFRHRWNGAHGKDITGYEDGTENPKAEAALAAAFVQGAGPGMDGSSFVAVQQWLHDLDTFEALAPDQANQHFGRDRETNEELEDAPEWAHVKRTAQEDFDPPAFVLRRSMPWMLHLQAGLMFVAFGCSFYAFEVQMRRMAGHDDGIVDGMFRISRPINGAYYWCPPLRDGRLDLRQLGLGAA